MSSKSPIDPDLVKVGGGLLLVYLFGRTLMKKLGLLPGASDEADDKALQQAGAEGYFSPNYWKKMTPCTILTSAAAASLAKTIYQAKGVFNDDEQAVIGAFRQIRYKTQVSYLAQVFYQTYQQDLYAYVRNFSFDHAELKTIVSFLNTLPSGKQ